jgi:transcriptional regulator with XRE-family HTH domain
MLNYKNMSFGEILKAFRLRLSMTQKEMADLLNAKLSTYKSWEYDKNFPSLSKIEYVYATFIKLGADNEKTVEFLRKAYIQRKVIKNGKNGK